jgi:uncharacterized protein
VTFKYLPPAIGVATAIAVTATMDATGLTAYSALPLCPLLLALWFWEGYSPASIGFTWGTPRGYVVAVLYPILVIGALALIAALAGRIDTGHTHWHKAVLNLLLTALATIVVAIVTEEGFFRGWLWASLSRTGLGPVAVLVLSSVAFSLWHVSFAVVGTDLSPTPAAVPVFLLNAAVIGAVWGLLRWISGSVLVSNVSHGLWNGLAYVLFGIGTKAGALGIASTGVFAPETGILGLALNTVFAASLFVWWRRSAGMLRNTTSLHPFVRHITHPQRAR